MEEYDHYLDHICFSGKVELVVKILKGDQDKMEEELTRLNLFYSPFIVNKIDGKKIEAALKRKTAGKTLQVNLPLKILSMQKTR